MGMWDLGRGQTGYMYHLGAWAIHLDHAFLRCSMLVLTLCTRPKWRTPPAARS